MIRLILFVLFAGVAVGAITLGVTQIGHKESGFHAVDYTAQDSGTLFDSGVHLQYYAEGSSDEIKQTLNQVQKLYSDLLLRAYMLTDAETTYENCPNISSLNKNVGEWVELDDDLIAILRSALLFSQRHEGYSLFSGALHREWRDILYLENPESFDPALNPDEAALLSDLARWAEDESAFSLEIEDHKARLTVSEAYAAWAKEREISAPALDLNLLRPAYLLQLTNRGLTNRGYQSGYFYTDSGLSLLSNPSGSMVYTLPGRDASHPAGEMNLSSPSAYCQFTAFSPKEGRYGYAKVTAGDAVYLRHPWVNTLTGRGSDLILSAAIGGNARQIVDAAYQMIVLNGASSLEKAEEWAKGQPADCILAYLPKPGSENVLQTNETSISAIKPADGWTLHPVP